jgi:hypothetical protein
MVPHGADLPLEVPHERVMGASGHPQTRSAPRLAGISEHPIRRFGPVRSSVLGAGSDGVLRVLSRIGGPLAIRGSWPGTRFR